MEIVYDFSGLPLIHKERLAAMPPLSFHRLFGLGQTAKTRREKPPSKPRINLEDLSFIIALNNQNSQPVTLIKPGGTAISAGNSKMVFKFDFDVRRDEKWVNFKVMDETQVTWNVVLKGYESVFTMMDCKGKGSFVSGSDGWFSSELLGAGWCCASSCGGSSGMVADMRLVMGGEGVVERVNVGVLSVVSWRYVGVDDALRYLQHFLDPC